MSEKSSIRRKMYQLYYYLRLNIDLKKVKPEKRSQLLREFWRTDKITSKQFVKLRMKY